MKSQSKLVPLWFMIHNKRQQLYCCVCYHIEPVELISPSPERHISFVAMEKMVTGLRPSTCLITGS